MSRLPVLVTASLLAITLAACEGNEIPPPSPEPEVEGTVEPGDAPEPAAETGAAGETAGAGTVDQEAMESVIADAERRAAEIVDQVTAREQNDTTDALGEIANLVPNSTTLQPSSSSGAASAGTLPAVETLELDTVAAANATGGPEYLGVWAVRANDCELMDQPNFSDFAVIAPETLRVGGTMCTIEPGALERGTATIDGQCMTGATDVPASFTVGLSATDELTLTEPSLGISGRYMRCALR